jgi:hypothetical protein
MSKLNLIAIVAIVAAFAVSAFVGSQVFAQGNSTSASSASGNMSGMSSGNMSGMSSGNMSGMNMPMNMTGGSNSSK